MAAKVLVTGATGFIGRSLCRRLSALGYDVFGLGRTYQAGFADFKEFYIQDITEPFTIDQDFDVVFHLAAHNITHVGNMKTDLYQRVNVDGTRHVIKATRCNKFVFLSTTKIYLNQGQMIDENAPLQPQNEYEKSKLAAEQLCFELLQEKGLINFRSVNIVGPGQSEKAVIPVLFHKASSGERMDIFGPREAMYQFLFVEDLIDVFVIAVEKGHVAGTFNLATQDSIRLDTLAFAIKRICDSKSEIVFSNEDQRVFSKILCNKIEAALGWKAKTPIQEILRKYRM